MICISLPGPSLCDLEEQVAISEKLADLIEFRLDLYDDPNIVRKVKTSLPIVLTCRNLDNSLSILESFFDMHPNFIDIEDFVDDDFVKKIPKEIKIIRSYHNGEKVPDDFSFLFNKPADIYKIACMANQTSDALKLLLLFKNCKKPVCFHAMGEKGSFTRILGKVFGSQITFASLSDNESTAPGQISIHDLRNIYHIDKINGKTKLYGLIGDPVKQSIGHIYHNDYMNKLDAVYIKMQVAPEELKNCLEMAKDLGFSGLSVTMPHKETIIPLLDEIDNTAKEINAVNTIKIFDGKTFGFNTDAKAALDCLGNVKNRKIALLGAGGVSRAISYEAKKRGATVVMFNRSSLQARKFSELTHFPYDIIINATPSPMPIDADLISSNKIAMDVSICSEKTKFLSHAASKNCKTIDWQEMFFRQAQEQTKIWF